MPEPVQPPPDGSPRGAYVPARPSPDEQLEQQDQRRRREFVPLKEYLNNIADFASRIAGSDANRERRRKTAKMRSFYLGNQVVQWDAEHNIWRSTKKPGDALYIDPVLATFIDIIAAQIVKSRPVKKVRARAEEQVEKQEAAKYFEEMLKDANPQLHDQHALQRETKMNLLLGGEAYRFTWFDEKVEGKGHLKTKFDLKIIKETPKSWICPECTAGGSLEDLLTKQNLTNNSPEGVPTDNPVEPIKGQDAALQDPNPEANHLPDPNAVQNAETYRCPDCDFPRVRIFGGNQFKAAIENGTEWNQVGDVNVDFADCLEMTVIGAKDNISEALIVMRERLLPRCVLEMLYAAQDLPSTNMPAHLRYQLISAGLENASADKGWQQDSAHTFTGTEGFEMLHFQELWLAPAVYWGYTSPRTEPLRNGAQLEKGGRLADHCERGIYFARIGKTVVDLYEQSVKDCWTHAVNSVSDSFHGAGEWDLMPLQEQKNELRSLQFVSIMSDSTRPLLIRASSGIGNIPNRPGAQISVQNIEADKPMVGYAIDRVPGAGSIPDAYALDDKLSGNMQQRTGAFSTTTDLPDLKAAGTATGMSILSDQATGRRAPALALRSQMEVEQAYQIGEQRQRYWTEQMYTALDKRVGGDAGKWFRESDIRRDFVIEVVPESYMPQTDAQKKSDFEQFVALVAPMAGGDPAVLKSIRQRGEELFGRGFDLENFQIEKVEAAVRLEVIRQIADYLETQSGAAVMDALGLPIQQQVFVVLKEAARKLKLVDAPEMVEQVDETGAVSLVPKPNHYEDLPLDTFLDRHAEYIEFYNDWLKSSAGRESSSFVRACVRSLAAAHREATAKDKADENALIAASEVPNAEAEMLLGAAQQEQQLEQQLTANDATALQQAEHMAAAQALGMGEQQQ